MKKFCLNSAIVLFFVYNSALASGVSQCYYCDNTECNDPFNRGSASIINCNNMSSYRSVDTENGSEWSNYKDVVSHNLRSIPYDANVEYICVKYFVNSTSTNYNFTMRRCMPKYIETVPACDYAIAAMTIAGSGRVEYCTTCDSNLCNSATSWTTHTIFALTFFATFGYSLQQITSQ